MNEKKCPECGTLLHNSETICPQCGYPLEKKSKKRLSFIIIAVSIVFILSAAIALYIPSRLSSQNFEKAQSCEANLDYEEAINYYTQVISRDDNYAVACAKIQKLSNDIKQSKQIAKAFVALSNQDITQSFSSLSEIRADSNKVSCRLGEIGYVISSNEIKEDNDYIFVKKDTATDLYVAKYEATYIWNSWLTEETNQIRQSTSDILFESASPKDVTENLIIDLAQKYFDIYEEIHDISILEDSSI